MLGIVRACAVLYAFWGYLVVSVAHGLCPLHDHLNVAVQLTNSRRCMRRVAVATVPPSARACRRPVALWERLSPCVPMLLIRWKEWLLVDGKSPASILDLIAKEAMLLGNQGLQGVFLSSSSELLIFKTSGASTCSCVSFVPSLTTLLLKPAYWLAEFAPYLLVG